MKFEFSKKCDLCGEKKLSRIFYEPVMDNNYPYLCKDCWEEVKSKISNGSIYHTDKFMGRIK